MTPILDSMAVLAAVKGHDKNEVCYLADKTWLDNSIFNKVRVRLNCGGYEDFVIREGRGFYAFIDEHGRNVNRWEDPDSVFYFSNEPVVQNRNKPTAFYSDPLNGCGVTVKTSWLNLYYLIDMATAELAKEINNIPTHDQAGKHYSKKERLNRFHDVIEGRIQYFIIDELPRTMVELLGHSLLEVVRLIQKELQTIYQLMFLLTDNKAGVGNCCFMWHLNLIRQGRNYIYIPHSDAIGDIPATIFNFPLGDCLSLGSGDDWVYWLGDDNIVYEESFDDAPDYYLFHNIIELIRDNKLFTVRFDCRWQYLSIGQHRLSSKEIMQDALTYGLKGIAEESFINKTFAKEVCKKGVASAYWDGIFHPDLSSLYNYYY